MPLQSIFKTEAFSHLGPGSGRLRGWEAQATDGSSETNFDLLILTFPQQMGCGALVCRQGLCVHPTFLPFTARAGCFGVSWLKYGQRGWRGSSFLALGGDIIISPPTITTAATRLMSIYYVPDTQLRISHTSPRLILPEVPGRISRGGNRSSERKN